MTNDQLSIVNNIDQFIVFGTDEKMHITPPADYADHVAVICSVIGDVDLYQQYPILWEAMFGLVDFEDKQARQFLDQIKLVIADLNRSKMKPSTAARTSRWLHEMYLAAKYELDKFGYIASTRIVRDLNPVPLEHVASPF